jgi:hypothetical protein
MAAVTQNAMGTHVVSFKLEGKLNATRMKEAK